MAKILLILLSALLPVMAGATIQYKALNKQVTASQRYDLDVDFDGINEYSFFYVNATAEFETSCVPAFTSTANYLTHSGGSIVLLEKGQGLGLGVNTWNNSEYVVSSTSNADRYLMIRFLINGSTHYGWICVFKGSSSLYIKSVAYEDEADKMILPGDAEPAVVTTAHGNSQIVYGLTMNKLSVAGVVPGSRAAVFISDLSGRTVVREIFAGDGAHTVSLGAGMYVVRCADAETGKLWSVSRALVAE